MYVVLTLFTMLFLQICVEGAVYPTTSPRRVQDVLPRDHSEPCRPYRECLPGIEEQRVNRIP